MNPSSGSTISSGCLRVDLFVSKDKTIIRRRRKHGVLDAIDWITPLITDSPMSVKEIFESGRAQGFSVTTIRKAAVRTNVMLINEDLGRSGRKMHWMLSSRDESTRRWIKCEFSPLSDQDHDSVEEVMDSLGYRFVESYSGSAPLPETYIWSEKEQKYIWTEPGPSVTVPSRPGGKSD